MGIAKISGYVVTVPMTKEQYNQVILHSAVQEYLPQIAYCNVQRELYTKLGLYDKLDAQLLESTILNAL